MVTHEFWREKEAGDYWAVELTEGEVTACAGPLARSELSMDYLPDLDYSTAEAARMQRERDRFDFVGERELLLMDGT